MQSICHNAESVDVSSPQWRRYSVIYRWVGLQYRIICIIQCLCFLLMVLVLYPSSVNDDFYKQSINIENWICYKNKSICCDRDSEIFWVCQLEVHISLFKRHFLYLKSIMSDDTMIYELESIWLAVIMALWSYCPSICLEGWGNPWKISVQLASVPAKIQTENLPDTSLGHYH